MHTLYVCVSVCVWVGVRERERERERVFGFQLFHTENALCKVVSEKIMRYFICIYLFVYMYLYALDGYAVVCRFFLAHVVCYLKDGGAGHLCNIHFFLAHILYIFTV